MNSPSAVTSSRPSTALSASASPGPINFGVNRVSPPTRNTCSGGSAWTDDAACPELLESAAERQEQERELVRGEWSSPSHVGGEILAVEVLAHHVGSTVVETARLELPGQVGVLDLAEGVGPLLEGAPGDHVVPAGPVEDPNHRPAATRARTGPPGRPGRPIVELGQAAGSRSCSSSAPLPACLLFARRGGPAKRSRSNQPRDTTLVCPWRQPVPRVAARLAAISHLVTGFWALARVRARCTVQPPTMAENFIFTMQDLRKVRGGKDILKGIYLSFFPGAKIGVIGPNGAGKSTLLRIMAGQDTEFFGTARPDPSIRVGFLPQEPQLDASLDVKGNVELGVKPIRDVLDRFNEVSNAARRAHGRRADGEAARRAGQAAGRHRRRATAGSWTGRSRWRWTRCACRRGDAPVTKLSGGEKRRVALCRILLEKPDLLLLDEPTNHLDAESVAWLERALKDYTGTVVEHHPRPVLPGQRGRSGSSSWTAARACPGRGTTPAGWSRSRSGWRWRRSRSPPGRSSSSGSWSGCARARSARQAKSKARLAAYEELLAARPEKRDTTGEITIPPGPEAGRAGGGGQGAAQGLRRPAAHRRPELQAAAGRHRRGHRAERRGQDHALPDDHRPGEAGRGRAPHRRRR